MSIESYRDLVAWQKSMDLVEAVYRVTQDWPRDELYGLTNQARRAAVSVPANIALSADSGQGAGGSTGGRDCPLPPVPGPLNGKAETLHVLSIADGSLKERETHIIIARRLGYAAATNHVTEHAAVLELEQCADVGRIIGGLIRSMRYLPPAPCPLPPANGASACTRASRSSRAKGLLMTPATSGLILCPLAAIAVTTSTGAWGRGRC